MSKNMTRKGLAFGAGLSLVASGFAGLPANAVGITGYIPLVPTTGFASGFAVEAKDGETFSLTSSPAGAVMGANVKFLVEDPDGKITPGANSTGGYSSAVADADFKGASIGTDVVTIGVDSMTDGNYIFYATGDLTQDAATDVVIAPADQLMVGHVEDNILTFKSANDLAAADVNIVQADDAVSLVMVKTTAGSVVSNSQALDIDGSDVTTGITQAAGVTSIPLDSLGTYPVDGTYIGYSKTAIAQDVTGDAGTPVTVLSALLPTLMEIDTVGGSRVVKFVAENTVNDNLVLIDGAADHDLVFIQGLAADFITNARASDNSYVVNSGSSTAGNQPAIELVATDAVTRTATVTAFVDLFADNLIGASEYVSTATAVTFVEQDDITVTTVLDAPEVGDSSLTAKVTTSPALNGAQLGNQELVRIVYSRQDGVRKAISAAATQNATTGVWTATAVSLSADASTIDDYVDSDNAIGNTNNNTWGITASVQDGDGDGAANTARGATIDEVSVTAAKVATITTTTAHGLRSGDKVVVVVSGTDSTVSAAGEATAVAITVTGTKTFTYALSETTAVTAATDGTLVDGTYFTVDTYTATGGDSIVDRVFAGDYSAQAALESSTDKKYALVGLASAKGTLAALADDVVFTTTASASVQGIEDNGDAADATNGDLLVKAGTTSLTVVATVVDEDDAAVGAGRNVEITMTNRSTNVTVNGSKLTQNLTTDANGQVTLVVASSTAVAAEKVDIKAIAEGVAGSVSEIRVLWATAAMQVADLNTTDAKLPATQKRTIAASSSYDVALLVTDQWYTAADAATYRVKLNGQGVTGQFLTLNAGQASFTVTDTGVSVDYNTVATLQKKNAVTGLWADTTTVVTLRNLVEATPGILVDADGSSLYGSAAADLSDAVAAKALVERDLRVANVAKPAYTNAVSINGKVVDTGTNVGQDGAVVTISGPTNILFSNGSVENRGSLTFVAAQSGGAFTVDLYSTTAQTDSVITITSAGVSKTVKVTFTGIGVGEGTSLVVTTPAAVKPASTFQVKAKLADVYGNGVDTAAGRVKVTYTGAGIVFGTLPTETDANGELQFSVLLGSNDTGTVSVTVSYDQNGDADYVDAKDLTTTSTTEITASGEVASAAKVNAGSFLGYVAVYAKGHNGSTISWKIAGKWFKTTITSDYQVFQRKTVDVGADVNVDIYIDGVKQLSKVVTTR